MNKFTVRPYLRTRENADGTHTIYIIASGGRGKVKPLSTGYAIEKKQWNKKFREVTASHPNHQKLNNIIDMMVAEVKRQYEEGGPIKIPDESSGSVDFIQVCNDFLSLFQAPNDYNRHTAYKNTIKSIEKYAGSSVNIKSINKAWADEYELFQKLSGVKNSTIRLRFSHLRAFLNFAVDQKKISADVLIFFTRKLKVAKAKKIPLVGQEITLMENFSGKPSQKEAADMWLFAMYNFGMRLSDVLLVKVSSVVNGVLTYSTVKGSKLVVCRLIPEALAIYKKYAKGKDLDQYLFSYMNRLEIQGRPIKQSMRSCNSTYRYQLKMVAKAIGLSRSISSHISRHSWTNKAIRENMPLHAIQRGLTHSSPVHTSEYIQEVSPDELNEMNEKMFRKER